MVYRFEEWIHCPHLGQSSGGAVFLSAGMAVAIEKRILRDRERSNRSHHTEIFTSQLTLENDSANITDSDQMDFHTWSWRRTCGSMKHG